MRNFNSLSAALLVALCSTVVQAQSSASQSVPAQAAQIVHLSASASAQVTQDWLVMTLATQKEGADAATVQKQIKTQLASALAMAQASAQSGLLDVSTGQLSVSQRYGRDGKTNGWTGVAELVLQRAMAYGAVAKANCTNSISDILTGVPGFETLPQTYFPKKYMEAFRTLPGVTERKITDDDADDNHGVLLIDPVKVAPTIKITDH